MTESMVEKVARAIWEETRTKWDEREIAGTTAGTRANYKRIASAAMKAMREPTKEMIYAGDSVSEDAGEIWEPSAGISYDGPQCGRDVWLAMIDAALDEKEPAP